MPKVLISFDADLSEEELDDLMACDPALLHEWVPELAEKVVDGSVTIREVR